MREENWEKREKKKISVENVENWWRLFANRISDKKRRVKSDFIIKID